MIYIYVFICSTFPFSFPLEVENFFQCPKTRSEYIHTRMCVYIYMYYIILTLLIRLNTVSAIIYVS